MELSTATSLFDLIMVMKHDAFDSMGPIISVASLLTAVTSCAFLVRTSMKIMLGHTGVHCNPLSHVKFLIIFLLVNQFQTLVLYPIDSMTEVVADGLGSIWEHVSDSSDIMGIISERHSPSAFFDRMSAIHDRTGSLVSSSGGQTDQSFLDMVRQDVESGTGPRTGADRQSALGRFGDELWAGLMAAGDGVSQGWAVVKGVRMAVSDELHSLFHDLVLGGLSSVFTMAVSALRVLVGLCLCVFSGFYLAVIGMIGPFAFAFSLIPSMKGGIGRWLSRYIQVAFWYPMAQLVGSLSIIWHNAFLRAGGIATYLPGLMSRGNDLAWDSLVLLVGDICVIAMYFAIPSVSKWVMDSSGDMGIGGSAARQTRQVAAVTVGKLI